jgi:tetratricopeptide (TPR) repeat protein
MVTEEEAIRQLADADASARRQAADRLGAIGGMQAITPLVRALWDEDWGVRALAENALWQIWCRSGDEAVDLLLHDGIQALERKAYAEAVATFTEVVARAPEFAEGYNKRATTHYLMGAYAQAITDCEATIARNPVHFGAMSGEGLCCLALGKFKKARECFRRALAVNPNMPGVQQNLAAVEVALRAEGNGGDA